MNDEKIPTILEVKRNLLAVFSVRFEEVASGLLIGVLLAHFEYLLNGEDKIHYKGRDWGLKGRIK